MTMDTLSTQKSLAHAAAEALRHVESNDIYLEPVRAAWALADSPIEKIMGEAIICCAKLNGGTAAKVIKPGEPLEGAERLLVAPQRTIGFYFADFAVIDQMHKRRLVVECDGYEFHDKSPMSVIKDRARDRFFLTQGWPVMRFNGSEITRQIDLCLTDIIKYLTGGDQ